MSLSLSARASSFLQRIKVHAGRLLGRPGGMAGLDHLEKARGYMDDLICTPQQVVVNAWMLHPERPLTHQRLYLNGVLASSGSI